MARSLFHHQAAHRLAAGKENIIKLLFQQRGVFIASALNDGHIFGRKGIPQQLCNGMADVGRVGAGLNHRRIARSQCIHQRADGQQQRIVPRAHNQHIAVGLGQHARCSNPLRQRRGHSPCAGKAPHMAQHIGQLLKHHANLAHIALKAALAQIRLERIQQQLLLRADGHLQLFQLCNSKTNIFRFAFFKISALHSANARNIHRQHSFTVLLYRILLRCAIGWLKKAMRSQRIML